MPVKYFVGIDIGSVSVKIVLLDEDGTVCHSNSEKIISSPRGTLNSLILAAGNKVDITKIESVGVSGSGKTIVPPDFNWTEYSSSLAISSGLLQRHPDARTIIQIGGQTSLVIELDHGLDRPWKGVSNPLCACGTGRFLEQQAYRLGIKIEDFGKLAMSFQGDTPRIAARCSVFAKSDLIHLQQKGVSVEAMLYALCESIARMVVSLKSGVFAEPVYFVGGVAANEAIARSLTEQLSVKNGTPVHVLIPDDYLYTEAIGSALLSRRNSGSRFSVLPGDTTSKRYYELPQLRDVSVPGNSPEQNITNPCTGYLGIDVGSTSTKAVIMDESGEKILLKTYLMTAGRPVDAVKQVFTNLLRNGAENVRIAGVGVTGSGRYLIGSLVGADLVKNEITAQTRAAMDISPEADIIEIGGQDAKLVIKRNGIVVDYQMNKACAAGTGSFIDEMAEMLGISVKNGEFASLALGAEHTIDLGTRCAAFMGQAVPAAQSEGIDLDVITASLATSIARNYLSKVVGTRKLGKKIILTGAVFYNKAVVSAFSGQLEGKELIVPEHREVSGAIGAALLAWESMQGKPSNFKGFSSVINAECDLSTFTCKSCDYCCAITQMKVPGAKPTFYGSRCDKYDSTLIHARRETFFDEREKLLFSGCDETSGTTLTNSARNRISVTEKAGPLVGIPRALLVYDYAPLLTGFLKTLGVRFMLSTKSNKDVIERSVELAYTDSCFPVKLLHGHTASLVNCDYLIFPCAIRLGLKDGDENQKYACPLVQASPFIVRQVLGLKGKLLIPIIDFSQGDNDVINNLVTTAIKMGFSRKQGKQAALTALEEQQKFDRQKTELGESLLEKLHAGDRLGVVLLARSYMSQDSGANLGIAEKLAQLGVVPIPLDFLPLSSVNPKDFSDRPYWAYESRLIAAADIIARNPQLFGLALTNFGCGPNSFILKELEDIMGDKPMGQLEIDEHAAEAGIVTRLEAFVDTITGFAHYKQSAYRRTKDIYRSASSTISAGKTLIIPRMAPHADIVAAAMQAFGVKAMSLPEPDERNILYSNAVTSGTECLPYRVTLGDFLKFHHDNGNLSNDVEGFMTGSFGPCRLGKYAVEQIRVLKDIGFNLPIRTTVSNNAYADLGLGPAFERLAYKGLVAVDYLQRLLWRVRPYEKQKDAADQLFDIYLRKIVESIRKKENPRETLEKAYHEFKSLVEPALPRRPRVGINGEIYLRSNRFSNKDLVKTCENAGLEVTVSPVSEWMKYISHRNLEDALQDRRVSKIFRSYIRKQVQERDERSIARNFNGLLRDGEISTVDILNRSSDFLSPRCGSEAVLSIGVGIEWLQNPDFSGVISVMPHGCMPGGIVAAMSGKFSELYQKPWLSLTYDGFLETNNATKINEFAELVKFCNTHGGH